MSKKFHAKTNNTDSQKAHDLHPLTLPQEIHKKETQNLSKEKRSTKKNMKIHYIKHITIFFHFFSFYLALHFNDIWDCGK